MGHDIEKQDPTILEARRVGRKEKDLTQHILNKALDEERIDSDEWYKRCDAVNNAVSIHQLGRLTADLPDDILETLRSHKDIKKIARPLTSLVGSAVLVVWGVIMSVSLHHLPLLAALGIGTQIILGVLGFLASLVIVVGMITDDF